MVSGGSLGRSLNMEDKNPGVERRHGVIIMSMFRDPTASDPHKIVW